MPKYKQNRLLFMSYNERNLNSHGQIYSFTIYYNKLPCTFISEIYIHKYHRNNVPTNRIDIISPSIVKDKLINNIYRVLILHPQDKLGMKILTLNIDYASKLHSRTLVLYVKKEDKHKIKDLESILRNSYFNRSIVNIVLQIKEDESGEFK